MTSAAATALGAPPLLGPRITLRALMGYTAHGLLVFTAYAAGGSDGEIFMVNAGQVLSREQLLDQHEARERVASAGLFSVVVRMIIESIAAFRA